MSLCFVFKRLVERLRDDQSAFADDALLPRRYVDLLALGSSEAYAQHSVRAHELIECCCLESSFVVRNIFRVFFYSLLVFPTELFLSPTASITIT